jgi:hypothetical protein
LGSFCWRPALALLLLEGGDALADQGAGDLAAVGSVLGGDAIQVLDELWLGSKD